ncbi:MAG TPA: SCO family protein [Tepidisphaeraceae bacterium]|jgi:protein SCO1/2|nr:SCO family protein [Tepidisphaeraceae bacterium]
MIYRPTLFLAILLSFTAWTRAQPSILKNVGIDQHLGTTLPLDTPLRDEQGSTILLSDCFHPGRPVILTFVYYKCPGLCTTTLNQLARSLTAISQSAGKDFDILTISFDPNETPDLALAKKQSYLRSYRRPTADAGWRFLTAPADSIQRLTTAAGFRYKWDDQYKVFAHASAVMILSPAGKITRYFLGVDYPPNEIIQALAGARADQIAPPAEQVFLYCFHYDPNTGKYGLIINRAIRASGVLILLALFGTIGFLVLRERRHTPLTPGAH